MRSRDSVHDVWGPRAPFDGEGRWPSRQDERTIVQAERWVQSVCILCSAGCGLDIAVRQGRMVGVACGAGPTTG